MKIRVHTAREFADAIAHLLPPGQAWDWEKGGFGDTLLLGTAEELARVDGEIQGVLDRTIELHRPKAVSWRLEDYQRVAEEALEKAGIRETMPRTPANCNGKIGDRLWTENAPNETWPVPLVKVKHLQGPAHCNRAIGDRLWSDGSSYMLLVLYYASVTPPHVLIEALMNFKQAHVYLWLQDITEVGGDIYVPHEGENEWTEQTLQET